MNYFQQQGEFLALNHPLRELKLGFNKFQANGAPCFWPTGVVVVLAACHLISSASCCVSLTVFLTTAGVSSIANALKVNTHLESLSLNYVKIDDEGTEVRHLVNNGTYFKCHCCFCLLSSTQVLTTSYGGDADADADAGADAGAGAIAGAGAGVASAAAGATAGADAGLLQILADGLAANSSLRSLNLYKCQVSQFPVL